MAIANVLFVRHSGQATLGIGWNDKEEVNALSL